jgi:hypothetical protein
MRNAYKTLFGEAEGRPKHIWDDIIRMDPKEIGWEVMDWIHLAQDRDH